MSLLMESISSGLATGYLPIRVNPECSYSFCLLGNSLHNSAKEPTNNGVAFCVAKSKANIPQARSFTGWLRGGSTNFSLCDWTSKRYSFETPLTSMVVGYCIPTV